jgi:hypothetical protein
MSSLRKSFAIIKLGRHHYLITGEVEGITLNRKTIM